MNKKAQMDLTDINWNGFIILTILGTIVVGFMLLVWKKMDFEIAWYVKVLMILIVPVASYIFTKLLLDE